jgi:hypothetical protein
MWITNCIGTPWKNLHGSDTTGHGKLKGVIVGVKRVDGPQPGQNRTLIRVQIESSFFSWLSLQEGRLKEYGQILATQSR